MELYQNAYVYVTASQIEGTSPALLTAMGAGRCVIVNGTDENLETIGGAGLSYSTNNVAGLRQVLVRVFADDNLVREYGKRACARVRQHYDWNAVSAAFAEVYERVGREKPRLVMSRPIIPLRPGR
jgi:glycosyltransferase involved in cell wall biosynthesis